MRISRVHIHRVLCDRPFKNRQRSQSHLRRRPSARLNVTMVALELHSDIKKLLFSESAIAERTNQIGRDIAQDYKDRQPILIAALHGAFMFLSDLSRSIQPPPSGMQLDFVHASSYTGKSTAASTGNVKFSALQQSKIDIKGRHVILVEDIVDSGHTALKLKEAMLEQGAESVKLVALLDKSERRSCDLTIDYCAFWCTRNQCTSMRGLPESLVKCPDEFVVGYGMDFNEHYRTLPYVGVLRPELYQ